MIFSAKRKKEQVRKFFNIKNLQTQINFLGKFFKISLATF